VSGNAVYTPKGPPHEGQANTVENNILAYARHGMLAVNSPYQNESGPPWTSVQAFEFNHNLMLFDLSLNLNPTTLNPSFTVIADCTYTGSSDPSTYGSYEALDWNLYWRTDQHFATDGQGFHVQATPGPGNGDPCERPNANTYGDFNWYNFTQWRTATGQDQHSMVTNPYFVAPQFPFDDYRLRFGSPIAGFMPFDADQAGRTEPFRWFEPPAVAPTFTVQNFNPESDF